MTDATAFLSATQASQESASQHRLKQMQLRALAQSKNSPESIDKTAKEFEAIFIGAMLAPMFAESKMKPPFNGGYAEEVFQSMLVSEYGKVLSNTGGLGIADQVKRVMLKPQEVPHANNVQP